MYKIIGADGKEYGPVSVEQLQQWLNEGRVNLQTRVLAEGATDWKNLGDVPELTGIAPVAAAPPGFASVVSGQSTAPQLLRGPAIFILVLAILNILTSMLGLVWGAVQDQFLDISTMPAESVEFQKKINMFFSLPANLLGGALAITCLFGSLSMMKLKSYGFAMATAIIMLIPCGNCCCFLNIGAGIWALVVLSKPEVKAAFQ
jgi:hypothetical protein